MKNNGLQLLKHNDLDNGPKLKRENGNRKTYFRNFLIFIILSLGLFGGIFFVKDKIDSYKKLEEDFNFQKQKIIDERMVMEKTLKEENNKLYNLQVEYEKKNEELTTKLNEIKLKEEKLNSELKRIEELKNLLKDQLVEIYKINIDKEYDSKQIDDEGEFSLNKGLDTDDKSENPIHTGLILGDEGFDTQKNATNEKILGVADADWFIKLDSLGEFTY